MSKKLLAGLFLIAFGVGSASADVGGWTPDLTLVAQIETKFRPTMTDGSLTDIGGNFVRAEDPLDQYARYYAGETLDGERIVVGVLILSYGESPGVHIVTMQQLPITADGGCGMMHLWYHVKNQLLESVCNISR
ncbi:MAG: hypothetical protein HY243_02910 [Proteobacteria bacterium]|nr:hypothetical protein [Pseudomonadota bacterium]